MEKEIRIKITSYDHMLLDSAVKARVSETKKLNIKIKGPIPLPTKKEVWTFCRSPHVDKPAMESFERLTHKRLIVLVGGDSNTVQNLHHMSLPSGVSIEIKN